MATEMIDDGGFETGGQWTEWPAAGCTSDDHDNSNPKTGSYNGLLDNTAQTAETTAATSLVQDDLHNQAYFMDDIANAADQLKVFVDVISQSADGYRFFEVRFEARIYSFYPIVYTSYNLRYRARYDGAALPSDTTYNKYIDLGTSVPSTYVAGDYSRNVRQDWETKFGSGSLSTQRVAALYLDNWGTRESSPNKWYGQEMTLDDISLLATPTDCCAIAACGSSNSELLPGMVRP